MCQGLKETYEMKVMCVFLDEDRCISLKIYGSIYLDRIFMELDG
jgi:hypothetical protein